MDLADLLDSVDIVEYIGQYVDLRERNGEFWGLSCFKDERTPSFSVRRDPPVFCDFSSGESGGILDFVRRYHHCSGREAVEILKKYTGITEEISTNNQKLATTAVLKRFQPPKPVKPRHDGVVLREDCMDQYEVNEKKLKIWEKEGISGEVLRKFNVRYDPFSNRLVYPIRDAAGRIVNIGGRALAPDWRERNLRKYTYYYNWGTLNVIYGLHEHRQDIDDASEVILFEGCKSVLLAETWGIRNTGAILTSHLNYNQVKLLVSLAYPVVFALDKDVDVTQDKNVNKLKHYVPVFIIRDRNNLLGEKDSPVDKGKEVFLRLYEERKRFY